MEQLAIMQSLVEALELLKKTRMQVANVSALWGKVNRSYEYLNAQLKDLLAEEY